MTIRTYLWENLLKVDHPTQKEYAICATAKVNTGILVSKRSYAKRIKRSRVCHEDY